MIARARFRSAPLNSCSRPPLGEIRHTSPPRAPPSRGESGKSACALLDWQGRRKNLVETGALSEEFFGGRELRNSGWQWRQTTRRVLSGTATSGRAGSPARRAAVARPTSPLRAGRTPCRSRPLRGSRRETDSATAIAFAHIFLQEPTRLPTIRPMVEPATELAQILATTAFAHRAFSFPQARTPSIRMPVGWAAAPNCVPLRS